MPYLQDWKARFLQDLDDKTRRPRVQVQEIFHRPRNYSMLSQVGRIKTPSLSQFAFLLAQNTCECLPLLLVYVLTNEDLIEVSTRLASAIVPTQLGGQQQRGVQDRAPIRADTIFRKYACAFLVWEQICSWISRFRSRVRYAS